MSLEERIVKELRAERDLVPKAMPGPTPTPGRTWPRRLSLAAAILVVVVGIVVTGWAVGRESSGRVADRAIENGEVRIDGDVVIPVSTEWGAVEARSGSFTVWVGAEAPAPVFDLDELEGREQPLQLLVPVWDTSVWAGDVPVVYAGDVNDRSVFVHTNGTIGLIERLAARFEGSSIGTHICLTAGSYDGATGGVGICGGANTSGGPFVKNGAGMLNAGWASWIDVPAETAVVVAAVDGAVVLWQRPIAETVFFDFGSLPEGPVSLTAISADGDELATETIPEEWYRRN